MKRISTRSARSAAWVAGVLALLALLGACQSNSSNKKKSAAITPGAYSTTTEVATTPFTDVAATVTATIPESAVSIGIVAQGTNTNYKVIDDGYYLSLNNQPVYITGPNGHVPLSFPVINGQVDPSSLANIEAAAVFFPNNGSKTTLPAGTYSFPVASFNAATTGLEADTMTTYVYYKTETTQKPTLKLNVFVVNSTGSSITRPNGIASLAEAQADSQILGAIQVLENVYALNTATALDVVPTIDFIADSSFATIDSDTEMYTLLASYPNPATNDAMNIFIIDSLAQPGMPTGVIGMAAGIPGPFNRQGTAVSGTLAEYQPDDPTGTYLGFTLAHEFGHFLGLYHTSQTNTNQNGIIGFDPIADTPVCTTAQITSAGSIDGCPDRSNLMFPVVDFNTNPDLTVGQGNVVKLNPGVLVTP